MTAYTICYTAGVICGLIAGATLMALAWIVTERRRATS